MLLNKLLILNTKAKLVTQLHVFTQDNLIINEAANMSEDDEKALLVKTTIEDVPDRSKCSMISCKLDELFQILELEVTLWLGFQMVLYQN